MNTEILKYLDEVAYITNSKIPNDDGKIYQSKVDGSYVGRVGLEHEGTVQFWMQHGIGNIQSDGGKTACIGFSDKEQKWYGWSHRAIFGFGIGSEVKRGDCGYHATDKEDFLLDMARFWSDDHHINVKGEHSVSDGEEAVQITWQYDEKTPNEKIRGEISGAFHPYPATWGRGEWVAKTIDDAKQMACDFAEGVS
jgi:hypothetical protein